MSKKIKLPSAEEIFDHWTATPNVIFDILMPIMDSATFKVLMVFVRQLYGFHKDEDYIAITQIVQKTGLSPHTVSEHLDRLKKSNIILITREPNRRNKRCTRYRLNTELLISIE